MRPKTTRILATGAAALALAGGTAAVAYAAGGSSSSGTAVRSAGNRGPLRASLLNAVASYLGLTEEDVRAQREAGKSLAQIASAQGKSVQGLKDAISNAAKAELDKAVAAGQVTSAQEQTILDRLKSRLDDIVNRTGPPQAPHRGGPHAAVAQAATSYLGLTRAELQSAREAGKSLAQIATEQGKSVQGLKDAIYTAANARLDKAVAAGRITSAQEATVLADLKAHLDDIVNRTGPPQAQ